MKWSDLKKGDVLLWDKTYDSPHGESYLVLEDARITGDAWVWLLTFHLEDGLTYEEHRSRYEKISPRNMTVLRAKDNK